MEGGLSVLQGGLVEAVARKVAPITAASAICALATRSGSTNSIHHVKAIAGPTRRNLDLYTRVLGLPFGQEDRQLRRHQERPPDHTHRGRVRGWPRRVLAGPLAPGPRDRKLRYPSDQRRRLARA